MYRKIIKIVPWVLTVLIIALAVWGWRAGLFSSQEELQHFIAQFGAAGCVVFTLIQIVQVVVPIIPGGVTCLAGVVIFGAVWGFVYNYIGLCVGSLIAFAIAKRFGMPLLRKMFEPELIEKYEDWTGKNNRFSKLFAIAIVVPGLPDDFLCYLAGTTNMTWRVFILIIFLGRTVTVASYSLGISAVDVVTNWI